ncbi:zinc finger protein 566 [Teleopsis dalmanni]|uniref:zinc finger protein 566 n=1 Tax=Teleopsis dalmanni TaxID=139649 RepID=UPI0018CF978F|nr:zinc finger protein 566 [Teleopsis dalmanni]
MENKETNNQLLPNYSCKRCKRSFKCKRDQLLHKKEVHTLHNTSYECQICNKFFCNNGNLERHMKVHNDVRPHVCVTCNKAFAQAVNLQRHYSVHSGERPYKCSFCAKCFTQQSNMQRHQLTHTGEKPFRCKRCGRYFSQRVNLRKHILCHLNAKPYKCKLCDKNFMQLQSARRHLTTHVKEGIVDVSDALEVTSVLNEVLIPPDEPANFECAVCRSIFSTFAEFELHEEDCLGTDDQPFQEIVVETAK